MPNSSLQELIKSAAQSQAAQDASTPTPIQTAKPKVPSKDSFGKGALRALIVALGAGLDAKSTADAMHTPGLEEQNSWLYGKHPSLGRMIATKTAINVPLLYWLHKVAQKEPNTALGISGVLAAPQAIQGVLNYATIKGQKKKNGGGDE